MVSCQTICEASFRHLLFCHLGPQVSMRESHILQIFKFICRSLKPLATAGLPNLSFSAARSTAAVLVTCCRRAFSPTLAVDETLHQFTMMLMRRLDRIARQRNVACIIFVALASMTLIALSRSNSSCCELTPRYNEFRSAWIWGSA